MSAAPESFFDQVTRYFNEAARFTTYPDGLLAQIRCCNSIYRFDFPLRTGRRGHRGDPRLARRAQPSQAADQGRHPLRPRRARRGGHGAGRPHDLQVRHRRRALRRRQGRHQDRAEGLHRRGAGTHHPALHPRARQEGLHRPRHRRAGARLRHRRARDGVDRRHLRRDASGTTRRARLRDRQAADPGRRERTTRGHRPRDSSTPSARRARTPTT